MIRRGVAVVALVLALVFPATPAEAHSFGAQGPTHTHYPCNGLDCYRWILANGAIIEGPSIKLAVQYGYVLVLCSQRQPDGLDEPYNEGWNYRKTPYGPFGNIGEQHPYCRTPKYFVPGYGTPFLAGWSVNA